MGSADGPNQDDDGDALTFDVSDLPLERVTVPTDDDAVARRAKAIAATRPLHDLERNKLAWDGGFWDRYDLISLANILIDQVALVMGISAGILYDDAVDYLTEQARRQHPAGTAEEHRAVAEKVVAGLVSDTPHEQTWVDHTADGPVLRRFSFRLLYEQWNADETVHLRASEQAINVLINALDFDDIESAQVAAETQIRALIDRGAFRSAVGVARQARLRTIQYLEKIRNIVRDTLIDPGAFDWVDVVPKLLADALDHVKDRVESEAALARAVTERRIEVADTDARRAANQLRAMLEECRSRHLELHRHLMGANDQLRRAQDDWFRRPTATLRRANLEADLVEPMLAAGVRHLGRFGEDVLVRFAAPRRLFLPSGAVLVDELLAPPPAPAAGVEVPDPIFDTGDVTPWWEPYWDAADALFAGISEPTRLSHLLEAASGIADASEGDLDPGVLVAAVCHVAHEHLGAVLVGYDTPTRILCAVPTGDPVQSDLVDADDLLIVPGVAGTADRADDDDLDAALR